MKFLLRAGLGVLILASLAACSGSHDGNDEAAVATSSLGGVAATGAPISGGTVALACAGYSTTTTTAASGVWAATAPTAALPCLVRVSGGTLGAGGAANALTLHSVVGSASAVANLTPLTDLALARAVLATTGQALADWAGSATAAPARLADVLAATEAARASLRSAFVAAGYAWPSDAFNPFIDAIAAGVATDAYDHLLDLYAEALAAAAGDGSFAAAYAAALSSFAQASSPSVATAPTPPTIPTEPTEPTTPVPGAGLLGGLLSQVFAGDYVLKCAASPGQAVETFAFMIRPDGSSVFNGAPLVDATHAGSIVVEGDLATSITLTFSPEANGAGYVVLGWKADGSFYPNSVYVPGQPYGRALSCYYTSGNTAPAASSRSIAAIPAVMAALARSETLNCSSGGDRSAQALTVGSDGSAQLGSLAMAPAKIGKLSDTILFGSNKKAESTYSDVVFAASGVSVKTLAISFDTELKTTGAAYGTGNGPDDVGFCSP